MTGSDDVEGWLFLRGEALPERWKHRAVSGALVPLLAGELSQLLAGEPVLPGLSPEDEHFVRLAARGLSVSDMMTELGLSRRPVERRLAQLRERFGVDTNAELAAFLARKGF